MSAARLFVVAVAGMLLGWAMANKAVATDCEKLGTFYDGKHVQHCEIDRSAREAAP